MAYLGPREARTPLPEVPWWKLTDATKRAEAVCATVDYLRELPEEKERQRQLVHHARLYGNRYFKGLTPFGHSRMPRAKRSQRLTANVCKAVVDTAQAKIAKNRPKATLLTNKGDWLQQQRAKKLDRFVEGAFQDLGLYQLGPKTFRTAGIFGDGLLKFYAERDELCVDRVLPSNVIVDPLEGIYGKPRCMYQTHWIDRHVLLDLYGGSGRNRTAEAIRKAQSDSDPDMAGDMRSLAEPVKVIEAWHLPSGPDAKDGLHVIAIPGAELRGAPWEREDFPFVRFTWSDRELGYWGAGLIEEVELTQLSINRTLKRIEDCLRLMAVPRIMVDKAANVVSSMITNEVGAILKYTGGTGAHPPQFMTPPAVPAELFHHLEWLIRQAFEMTGVSQLSATSQKPSGLDSGRALLVYNDIETERFSIAARSYEQFYMDCADQILALAEAIDKNARGGFSVVNRSRTKAQRLRWKDVRMDRESYTLQVHPTSALPRDVAGRTATVQQWVAAGFVSQKTAQKLLDFPDLDAHTAIEFAPMEIAEMTVERFLDPELEPDEAYLPPEPFDDLAYALPYMVAAYQRARLDGAPEERLELFRQWFGDADALLAQAEGAAAPAPAEAMTTDPALAGPPQGLAAMDPANEMAA